MNYFAHRTAARRYAASRPFFHPQVVARIKSFLEIRAPLSRALDVACGTGQSTIALREIARNIVGADVSKEMLREASRAYETLQGHEAARGDEADEAHETPVADEAARAGAFVVAQAERLPFAGDSFDLITVSMSFHWLDRARFLDEARRLLRRDAWLVVYNNLFFGTMRENPAFALWHRDSYLARFPAPPRHRQPLTTDDTAAHGLSFARRETYANDVRFTPEELASYLTTQSNVIAAVEHGKDDLASVRAWLVASLAPLFPSSQCTFSFGGDIWYLQKQ